jgi:hypothetical protein
LSTTDARKRRRRPTSARHRRKNCSLKTTTNRNRNPVRLNHTARRDVIAGKSDLILLNYGAVISRHGVLAFGAGFFRPPLENR